MFVLNIIVFPTDYVKENNPHFKNVYVIFFVNHIKLSLSFRKHYNAQILTDIVIYKKFFLIYFFEYRA